MIARLPDDAMTPERFATLAAQGYNRIPLVREVLADLDTPLSAYLKLAGGPYSCLFESVHGGEKWGRYSILVLPSRTRLEVSGHRLRLWTDGRLIEEEETADPLAWIAAFQRRFKVAPTPEGMPRFAGGLAGYFGYDSIRYIEPRLAQCPNPDPLGTPDILLMVADEIVVFDNLSGRLYLIIHLDPTAGESLADGEARLNALILLMRRGAPRPPPGLARRVSETDFVSGFTEAGFKGRWSASRTTSWRATACRSSSPSACPSPSRPGPWTSTGPCAASIPRPTCTSWTWGASRSSAPRRRF
jgi:anthranilate synthase component 1